jgi:hypothetical protein
VAATGPGERLPKLVIVWPVRFAQAHPIAHRPLQPSSWRGEVNQISRAQNTVQALRDKCKELTSALRALSTLIHSLRMALVGEGLFKGGA